jgi:hypothetical protein
VSRINFNLTNPSPTNFSAGDRQGPAGPGAGGGGGGGLEPIAAQTGLANLTNATALPVANPASAFRNFVHVSKSTPPTLWAWDNGDGEIYVRMPFNATLDLVCNMRRNATTNNPGFIFDELGTVANTTEYGGTPSITSIASFQDETMGYLTAGNGRAGGAHSLEIVAVTRAGHGLTTADIGKRFQGSDSRLYVITNIISSSVFWMVQQPITLIGDTGFTRYLPAAATTLTALDGQGNQTGWTAAITTSDVGPTANADMRQEFLIDGEPLIPGRLVNGSRLDIIEYTRVPNLRNAYAYFVATGPTATWTDAALGGMWTRTVQYTWFPWCQLTVEDNARLLVSGLRMNDAGNIQYNPLLGLVGSQNLHVQVPGIAPITFTGTTVNGVVSPTIDYNTPQPLTTASGTDMTMENATLIAGVIPDHVIQFAAPGTGSISGWTSAHLAAFDPTFADCIPSVRSSHCKEFLRIAPSSRKFYPMNFSLDSALAQFRTIKIKSHRRWTPPVSGIDFWTFVKSDDAWLVYINWQTSPGTATITLPAYLAGLTATAAREFRGSLVSTNTANGTLQLTTTANNGHMIVRLA